MPFRVIKKSLNNFDDRRSRHLFSYQLRCDESIVSLSCLSSLRNLSFLDSCPGVGIRREEHGASSILKTFRPQLERLLIASGCLLVLWYVVRCLPFVAEPETPTALASDEWDSAHWPARVNTTGLECIELSRRICFN